MPADSSLAASPSSSSLRGAMAMQPHTHSTSSLAAANGLSASPSLSHLAALPAGSPRYLYPTVAFTSSALSPATSTTHLLMHTSSPRRTAKTFHVEPVAWDCSDASAAMSSLSYPQLRAVLSAPPPSVPTPSSVSRYKIRCFNNESTHHGVMAPPTIRAHLAGTPQSARKAAVEAITAAAAAAHTRSHVALQSFTDRRHLSPHQSPYKPRAPISEPEFRRRLDLAVNQSLQLQYQHQLQRHAEVEMERVFGLTNAPPLPKPLPPTPMAAAALLSATQTRAPSHSPSMHTLRAPTASPSTASLHASPVASPFASASKRASFTPLPGLQFQSTINAASTPRRSSSSHAPPPFSPSMHSLRADASSPVDLTVPAEETWEAQQQRHLREQEERDRIQEPQPAPHDGQQATDSVPALSPTITVQPPEPAAPAVPADWQLSQSVTGLSTANEPDHTHSQSTILTVHSSPPPPQQQQQQPADSAHHDAGAHFSHPAADSSVAPSSGHHRTDSSSPSGSATHSRHTSIVGANSSSGATFGTPTRAPVAAAKGGSSGGSPHASGSSTPSRGTQPMRPMDNGTAAAAALSLHSSSPVAPAHSSSHSTFADVNALLNSALEDAKQSAVRTHANMPTRTPSFKLLLHAAAPDGRSTGASPSKNPAGTDSIRTKHMRRPSNTLASSLLDDAVDNLMAFSINDRLESNRLASDPELRSMSNRAQGRGFNVHAKKGAAAPPPETEMAHWALQVHEIMIEEKRRAEAEEKERKKREEEEAQRRKAEEAAKAKAEAQAAAVAAMQATPQGYTRRIVT